MVSPLHNLNLAGAIKLLRQAQQSYIKLQGTMSEFQNYNGPIIDVWANWWGDNFFVKFPRFKELYERIGIEQRMANSSKSLLMEAKKAKISKVILSATVSNEAMVTNEEVLEVAKKSLGLVQTCASVDPRQGMASIRMLRSCVKNLGCTALKFLPFLYGLPPNHASYFPLYAECVELNIPVLILTGHTAVNLSNETGRPSSLDDIALHFPELKIIAGHAGYPWSEELIALSWKHQNLYIDTSGHHPKFFPEPILRFLKGHGRDKVLFGTGYPMMEYKSITKAVFDLDLKDEILEKFLFRNAVKIWPNILMEKG